MWPGRRKSSGAEAGSTHFMAVTERSWAEIPVAVLTWSMDTVNAVSWLSVFWETICGSFSRAAYSCDMGMQISPFPCTAIKLRTAVSAYWAAQIKSPSFSRSGSSAARIMRPAFNASRASSMVLNAYILNSFPALLRSGNEFSNPL